MRKVILQVQASLDGYIEGPNGAMDWFATESDELWQDLFARFQSVDTFLLGRVMYPGYARYWESMLTDPAADKNKVAYARMAAGTQHIVFTHAPEKIDKDLRQGMWEQTRFAGDVAGEIARLKSTPGKNIVVFGGATLASSLMNLGLIDEYYIFVNPVVLGGGKSLFSNVNKRYPLKFVDTKTYSSGTTMLHYSRG